MDEKDQKVAIINAQLLSALVNIETAQSLMLSQKISLEIQEKLYNLGLLKKDIYLEALSETIDSVNANLDKINQALLKITPEGGEEE